MLNAGNRIIVSILFHFNIPILYVISVHLIEDRLEIHLTACADLFLILDMDSLELAHYKEQKDRIRRDGEQFLLEACEKMNQAVCDYGTENRIDSMGTTAAMLAFGEDMIYGCNLGDSRIYRSNCEKFGQISEDHTLGRHFLGKAPLTQYLGMQEEDLKLAPSLTSYPVVEGDRYLICSDGITDMLSDGEIADIFTREIPVEETVQVLVERALKKGGRDNITVILCEVMNQKENWWKRMWNQLKRHEGDIS